MSPTSCPTCGSPLAEGADCPGCLLGLGFEEDDAGAPPDKPERVGPYRVLEILGQGGMGIVYLAEQERPIRRRVALKLIKPGMDSDQVLHRFESERQALALIAHPNVAKVFDAGVVEDGRPYFVLEYVPGEPITAYCDRERLSVRERVDLFLQTCDALEHAHRTGIIHRDVKPSNVLVCHEGDRATVKVIDFGVAKALHQKLTDRTLHTRHGIVLGTPEYMSPEQAGATSAEVDARADVYSLGVVLYELLVGALPFDPQELRVTSDVEMLRMIREVDPPRPSARLVGLGATAAETARRRATDLPTLTRLVSGELAWITLKALEKDPGRRYASAAELAADLRRFLAHRPVLARPRTVWYRARKLMRRNRGAAFALAGIVLALAAGAAAMFVVLRADRARPATTPSFERVELTRLTSTGDVLAGTITPDGRHAALVHTARAGNSIWIHPVPDGTPWQVVAPEDQTFWSLSFAADGQSLYYVSELRSRPVGGVLYNVPLRGGGPRSLLTDVAMVRAAPDGHRLLFRRWIGSPPVGVMMLANPDGTEERLWTSGTPSHVLLAAAWAPDSRSIAYAFSDHDAQGEYWGVVTRRVDGGPETTILTGMRSYIGGLAWLPDGTGLLMNANDRRAGYGQIWHVALPGGALTRVTRDLSDYGYPELTADGSTILTIGQARPARIWIVSRDEPDRPQPAVPGSGEYGDLAWAPDGSLIYVLTSNPERNLWKLDRRGEVRQLTARAGSNLEPSVSPDGRFIVFLSSRTGETCPWRMDADGGNPVQLSTAEAQDPQCSPDGKWVWFRRTTDGRPTLWRVPIDGGAPVQETEDETYRAALSPDGRWLAHETVTESRVDPRVAIRPLAGGPPVRMLDVRAGYGGIRFTPESDGLVYIGNQDADLLFQPLTGGPPRVLLHVPYDTLFAFALSPDGTRIAYTSGLLTPDAVLLRNLR